MYNVTDNQITRTNEALHNLLPALDTLLSTKGYRGCIYQARGHARG